MRRWDVGGDNVIKQSSRDEEPTTLRSHLPVAHQYQQQRRTLDQVMREKTKMVFAQETK